MSFLGWISIAALAVLMLLIVAGLFFAHLGAKEMEFMEDEGGRGYVMSSPRYKAPESGWYYRLRRLLNKYFGTRGVEIDVDVARLGDI